MQRRRSPSRSRLPSSGADGRLETIVSRLEARYALQRHANLRDAFWELIFIIISVRTAEQVYKPTFRQLRRSYPSIESLRAAGISPLVKILRPAGLARLKASQIRSAARAVFRDFGKTGLTRAGRRDPASIEAYLQTLNGVGVKVAKCVTMYACDSASLPVDAHVWRVMSRLGYAPGGRLTEKKALLLEASIAPHLRFAVHVLSISHGRAVCRARPLCGDCVISELCPSAHSHQAIDQLVSDGSS
jgi:endonuclease III